MPGEHFTGRDRTRSCEGIFTDGVLAATTGVDGITGAGIASQPSQGS